MKKFNIRLLLLFVSLSFMLPVSAQINRTLQQIKTNQAHHIQAMEDISHSTRSGKVHHFYIDKNWQNSFVITLDEETIYFNGRYNVLNKTIEYISNGEQRVVYAKKIKAAMVGEHLLIPIGAEQIKQVDNNRYLEVLSSGQINLLNSYILESKMETGSSISFEGTGKKTYFVDEVLYYTSDFNTIQKLPNAKNKVLDLFKNKSELVSDFVKTERLRFNDKSDLVKIFDFYNSLF